MPCAGPHQSLICCNEEQHEGFTPAKNGVTRDIEREEGATARVQLPELPKDHRPLPEDELKKRHIPTGKK
jgi:hypothetical protein